MQWFETDEVDEAVPLVAQYNNKGDSLTNLLWTEKDPQWIERIFGAQKQTTIKKSHVEALMLQLVACGIFEYVVECDKRMWKWGRVAGKVEKTTVKCYTVNENWQGINYITKEFKKRKPKTGKSVRK